MKRIYSIFAFVAVTILLWFSCSKMPVEPKPAVKTANATATVLGVDAVDNTYLSGVSVYTQEGVPATLRPWPEKGRNLTPIEPNNIEPGHYLFVGIKAGYDTAYSPLEVTITDTVSTVYTVYLIMHKIKQKTLPDSLIYIEGGDSTSCGDTLVVQGTKTIKNYKVIVLNGSNGPIRHIDMKSGWDYKNKQQFIIFYCNNNKSKLPLDQFSHKYTKMTLQSGIDPERKDDWLWYGRYEINFGLLLISKIAEQDQWYKMLRL